MAVTKKVIEFFRRSRSNKETNMANNTQLSLVGADRTANRPATEEHHQPTKEGEFVDNATELTAAREELARLEREQAEAARLVVGLESGLDAIRAEWDARTTDAVKNRRPVSQGQDPREQAALVAIDTSRRRLTAIDSLLGDQRAAVSQLEEAERKRKDEEFVRASEAGVADMMIHVAALFGSIDALDTLCQAHGRRFNELPFPQDGPNGRGGPHRPDSTYAQRLQWIEAMRHLFSMIGNCPKHVTQDDIAYSAELLLEREKRLKEDEERRRKWPQIYGKGNPQFGTVREDVRVFHYLDPDPRSLVTR
jgi:hypothetical protein